MNRPRVLVGLLCVIFMTAVEATVVATAMPSVIADLGGVSLYGWVSAVYLLGSTVTVPIYGKLSDQKGRKPIMMFGIALFLVGSAWSGAATSTTMLIAARALQGLGAGAVQPTSMTIIGDIYTIEERGRIQGWFGSVWAIAGGLGPLLGGFFVSALSWRWVFWFNVPFGLAAVVVLMREFKEQREVVKGPVKLDWIGVVTMSAAAVAILSFAERRAMPLTLAIAVVSLAVFILHGRRTSEPLIPFKFFSDRFIAVGLLVSFFVGAVMLGHLTYAPLYIQGVLDAAPARAGSALTPMLITWPIASNIVGRKIRTFGFRAPVIVGSLICAAGGVTLAVLLPLAKAVWPIWLASALFGTGMGTSVVAIVVALQSSVPWNQRGVVTALSMFTRTMGAALCVGALGALLTYTLSSMIDPEQIGVLLAREKLGNASTLAPTAVNALAASFGPLTWTIAGISIAMVLASLLYRPPSATAASQPAQAATSVKVAAAAQH